MFSADISCQAVVVCWCCFNSVSDSGSFWLGWLDKQETESEGGVTLFETPRRWCKESVDSKSERRGRERSVVAIVEAGLSDTACQPYRAEWSCGFSVLVPVFSKITHWANKRKWTCSNGSSLPSRFVLLVFLFLLCWWWLTCTWWMSLVVTCTLCWLKEYKLCRVCVSRKWQVQLVIMPHICGSASQL